MPRYELQAGTDANSVYGGNLTMQVGIEGGILSQSAGFETYRPVVMDPDDIDDSPELRELRKQISESKLMRSAAQAPALTPCHHRRA